MFHTLFEHKDKKSDKIRNSEKFYFNQNKFQIGTPHEYYFGKGNKAIDQYNIKKKQMENDANFEKTKNKIKLVVYRNGFILNNSPFRDRNFPENQEFLSDVEKGNIPQELIQKGMLDLGILLINRKTEMFRSPLYQSLPTSFNFFNISEKSEQNQPQNGFKNNGETRKSNKAPYIPQTPMESRSIRRNIFVNKSNVKEGNRNKNQETNKRTNSLPKDKKIITLNDIFNKNQKNTFTPFTGEGHLLANANIDGIMVDVADIIDNDFTTNYSDNSSSSNLTIFDEFCNTTSQVEFGTNFNAYHVQNITQDQFFY